MTFKICYNNINKMLGMHYRYLCLLPKLSLVFGKYVFKIHSGVSVGYFLWYKVVMTGCEVVLVNRNVTDSFRVGKDGCTSDTSVCKSNATCQPDGSCLCNSKRPSY
jgi:hypothetical protein